MKTANEIVTAMLQNDAFSKWLGIELLTCEPGKCKLQMKVRDEMLNGFYILHGGITYSLADSALAFACNARGYKSYSIETSISHHSKVETGDTLIAETEEVNLTKHTAVYLVRIYNRNRQMVSLFKGSLYRSEVLW